MAENQPYGMAPTAQALLERPYGGISPFGPAGMTDAMRQGQMTQLQGMASQYDPAQQYARDMGNLAQQGTGAFMQGMNTGQFGWNPAMQGAYDMAGQSAGPNQFTGMAAGATMQGMDTSGYDPARAMYGQSIDPSGINASNAAYRQGMNQQGFGAASSMAQGAMNQPGFDFGSQMLQGAPNQRAFDQAAQTLGGAAQQPGFGQAMGLHQQAADNPGFGASSQAAGNTMANFGGGYSQGMADTINQTGASFDPFNNPALGSAISSANARLGRDFNQSVMPELNRAATGAGAGAYGGTRAGVAQGIREQGLADAMAKQTADMTSQGYAEGLNRYVQDRGQTLGTTIDAMRTGADTGFRGAELLGNNAAAEANAQNNAARGITDASAAEGGLKRDVGAAQTQLGSQKANAEIGAGGKLGDIANMRGQLQHDVGRTMADISQMQAMNSFRGGEGLGNNADAYSRMLRDAGQRYQGIADSQTGNALQAGDQFRALSNAQQAAQGNAASTMSSLGQHSLGQSNDSFFRGYGDLMPSLATGAYGAGIQPGQLQERMGGALQGMGAQQQQQNQNQLDHMNRRFDHAQQMPQTRWNEYLSNMRPILTPGTSGTSVAPPGIAPNPYMAAGAGGLAGYGAYNAYQRSQQPNAQSGANSGLGGTNGTGLAGGINPAPGGFSFPSFGGGPSSTGYASYGNFMG